MIIERPNEIEKINSLDNWTMVYGRRKTGKTFLVKNYVDWDDYFFVKRDRTILSQEEESINYDTFTNILQRNIKQDRVTVIDEFHRLPEEFFDLLHAISTGGRVILISSTLHLSKELLSTKSPLLGLFAELPMHIISLENTLKAVEEPGTSKKQKLELSVILREPITARFITNEPPREILNNTIMFSRNAIPALIGEIFSEEERTLSRIYEGILRAVADGNLVSGEISSYLFSNKLIKKDDPSTIQNHLKNLVDLGILKRVKVHNKNRYKYKHRSPLVQIFYFADEKYNISEREPSSTEIRKIIDENLPDLIEDTVREHLAEKHGLTEAVIETPDYDVDICLLRFQEPEIVGEVKWKKEVEQSDVKRAEEILSQFEAEEKYLFVPNKEEVTSDTLEVIDVTDL